MVTVQIEPTELEDIKLIAQKRHNAKDKSFRNTGILIPDPASVYAPHTIGLVGEFAWGKHTNQTIDEKIYTNLLMHENKSANTKNQPVVIEAIASDLTIIDKPSLTTNRFDNAA